MPLEPYLGLFQLAVRHTGLGLGKVAAHLTQALEGTVVRELLVLAATKQ